jgi:hypothetical protein
MSHTACQLLSDLAALDPVPSSLSYLMTLSIETSNKRKKKWKTLACCVALIMKIRPVK